MILKGEAVKCQKQCDDLMAEKQGGRFPIMFTTFSWPSSALLRSTDGQCQFCRCRVQCSFSDVV
eukprot:6574089-Pyramimonas_sp.AAC.1